MDIEALRASLIEAASRGHLREVARASGIPYGTVRKIRDGVSRNPRIDTFCALVRYFQQNKSK